MKLIDAHCHLNDQKHLENLDEIINDINDKLDYVVCSGWDLDSSILACEIANKYDKVYASIGFHPTDISTMNDDNLKIIESLAINNKKVVGIGEIGLDYYWMKDPKQVQINGLLKQIDLIRKIDIPIVVHTRDALADTIDILKDFKDVGGVLHCFPGSYESVLPILDRYYVSVGGTLTFKNNKKTQRLVDLIDINRLVIETDSPYLTPEPYRGRVNSPTNVIYVAKKIAEIKNMQLDDVIRITRQNTIKAYRMENIWK